MKRVTLALVWAWCMCVALGVQASWYAGGTLHGASALEWQHASEANKLSTAADFVGNLYNNGHLNVEISQSITDVNGLRPLAQELVNQLNEAFTPDPDPEENRRLFTNMNVGHSAALIMLMNGWVE